MNFHGKEDTIIVVAVSGGSDSMALLYKLVSYFDQHRLRVATVDHQLRPEAQSEATHVGTIAASLGLPHQILIWHPPQKPSSSTVRDARYQLLASHARSIGAGIVALGHTLDDQAETVMMRAMRVNENSDGRGLSGMGEWSSYDTVKLWRPLLNDTRAGLRAELSQHKISWIDDPSNEKNTSERVRVRRVLDNEELIGFSKAQIVRLANLSARSRSWLSGNVANIISDRVHLQDDGKLHFIPPNDLPTALMGDVLSVLVWIVGGMSYRTPSWKFSDLVLALKTGQPQTKAVGRCLIKVRKGSATIEREHRKTTESPSVELGKLTEAVDAPIPSTSNHDTIDRPSLLAMERFRPHVDDPVYEAVVKLLKRPFCST